MTFDHRLLLPEGRPEARHESCRYSGFNLAKDYRRATQGGRNRKSPRIYSLFFDLLSPRFKDKSLRRDLADSTRFLIRRLNTRICNHLAAGY